MLGFDRITADPDILGRKACVRGMRISVTLTVNLIANDRVAAEILREVPDLEREYSAGAASLTIHFTGGPVPSLWEGVDRFAQVG